VKGFFCFRATRIYSCKRKNKKSWFLRSKKSFWSATPHTRTAQL